MTKAPIALRALPQRVGEGRVDDPPSMTSREVAEPCLPQLVGEVPEGRWGPFAMEFAS